MIHALTNALAMAPGTATSGPSQHIHDLNTILNQVEKFYGQGWHSLSMENAAIFAVAAAVITVIGVVVGALVPILINNRAEKKMLHEIALAQRRARINTEVRINGAMKGVELRLKQLEEQANQRIEKARTQATQETEKALHQASKSIQIEKERLLNVMRTEVTKVEHSVRGHAYFQTGLATSGRLNAKTKPTVQELEIAMSSFFWAMCEYSMAGKPDLCRTAGQRMAEMINDRRNNPPNFDGRAMAEELSSRELYQIAARDANTGCKQLIEQALAGLRQGT